MKNVNEIKSEIKNNISSLIEKGNINSARSLINEYENIVSNDINIYSTKAVIAMIERNFQEAESILREGLKADSSNFDILYNLGYLYQTLEKNSEAFRYYKRALKITKNQKEQKELNDILNNILYNHKNELELYQYTNRKKALVVAYAFPPIGGSGVQRTLKFVKYLREFGWEPIVLTVGNNFWNIKDETLLDELPKDIKIIRIDDIRPERLDDEFINKLLNMYFDVIEDKKIINEYIEYLKGNKDKLGNMLFIPEYQSVWAKVVIDTLEDYIDLDNIDIVYTSADPYADNFIGYYLKKKHNIPWVADFRDEWTNHHYRNYDKTSIRYKMEFAMESKFVHTADKVITTTPISTDNYRRIFGLEQNKVITITNGYDEQDFTNVISLRDKNNKFTIMHNGIFHDGKNPETFLKALRNLIHKGLIDRKKVKVYFTVEDKWKSLVKTLGLEKNVEYLGYLEHKKSLGIANKCDSLLLVVGTGDKLKQVIAAKMFEYFRLNKPILSLAPKGGAIDNIINETNRGYNVDYDDIDGIEKYLLKLYKDWESGKQYDFAVDGKVKRYERKELTKKLCSVFNELRLNSEIEYIKNSVKDLIEKGSLEQAKSVLDKNVEILSSDTEIYSIRAIIAMMQSNFKEAESILKEGLKIDSRNVDLNYNLGYLYEQKGQIHKALEYYKNVKKYSNDVNLRNEIDNTISKIEGKELNNRKKIVFFSKGDDKFIWDIINELSKEYETKKITVTKTEELKLIDKWMDWADICWFEWCDELVTYGSGLEIARNKKIICRIHGYEVYTNYIRNVNWKNVDDLIIVAPHIKRIFEENTRDIDKGKLREHLIYCGINVDKYPLNIKTKGFNLGYLGYINFKKNIPLTLDIFKKLHDIDNRYKLHIAGEFQDNRTLAYLKYFLKEHKLEDSFVFYGWQNHKEKIKWLKNIDYMIISSIDEGLCFAAAEAMCSGIKPILHNCEGIKDHYDPKYIFNSIDEAINMIIDKRYNSKEYREFIENKYSLEKEIVQIKKIIKSLIDRSLQEKDRYSGYVLKSKFDYKTYWEERYKSGGNSGSGSYGKLAEFKAEIINKLIYENNIENVIEFGCGDGNQLEYMQYENYIGLDISPSIIKKCQKRFKHDKSKTFINYIPGQLDQSLKVADMVVCLDVLYHIIDEEDFVKTLDDIFSVKAEFIVIYTILYESKDILPVHMKYRNIIEYLNKYKDYSIDQVIKQKYTDDSLADFIILRRKRNINTIHLIDEVKKSVNDFAYFTKDLIDTFDFSNCSISIGKLEVISQDYLLIEYIMSNTNNKQLVLTGIVLQISSNKIIYPEYIRRSKKAKEIDIITRRVIQAEKNKMSCSFLHGFIYNQKIIKDIELNKLAYNWERAIPGTQFMPLEGYLNVILRYKLAGNYISKNDYVLEAGSGFGYGAAYLSNISKKVEALDIAKENIEFGKNTYDFKNINWVQGDVTNLPYEDNTFDVYVTYETLEHIPLNLVEDYLSEASRVLKKEGKFIISTPNRINRKNVNNPFHIKEYDFLEFDKLLKKYFRNIEYYSIEGTTSTYGISSKSKVMIAIAYNQ